MTDVEKLIEALRIQYNRPAPELPDYFSAENRSGYRIGWEDAMMHIREAVATYDYEG